MSCARETTLFLHYVLNPLKPKTCAGHNSHTVGGNLIFGKDIYIWSSRSVTCKKDKCCFVIFF